MTRSIVHYTSPEADEALVRQARAGAIKALEGAESWLLFVGKGAGPIVTYGRNPNDDPEAGTGSYNKARVFLTKCARKALREVLSIEEDHA